MSDPAITLTVEGEKAMNLSRALAIWMSVVELDRLFDPAIPLLFLGSSWTGDSGEW